MSTPCHETAASGSAQVKILVMCSGSGSNLQALIDALTPLPSPSSLSSASPRLPRSASITHVICNRRNARALVRAADAGISTTYFNLVSNGYQRAGESDPAAIKAARESYDADLAAKVLDLGVDLVVLAGWMHVFSPVFFEYLSRATDVANAGGADSGRRCPKIINLHPALPGKYDGANAIQRAYADFLAGRLEKNRTGCMVHYVIAEVDRGEPIIVQEIECLAGDSLEQLEERIHVEEHRIIVEATTKVVDKIAAEKQKSLVPYRC